MKSDGLHLLGNNKQDTVLKSDFGKVNNIIGI
jgi:hypothetical protein